MGIQVFDIEEDCVRLPLISDDARFVIGPHSGSDRATLNYVILKPGEENQPHDHPYSEDTIFCLQGEGEAVDVTNEVTKSVEANCVIHVPPGVEHTVRSTGDEPMVSIGGPCPPHREMLEEFGITEQDAS